MKTITVKQPWASLIVEGLKDIENRTWPTKFRGRVLIHAGATPVKGLRCEALDGGQYARVFSLNRFDALTGPVGVIIGSVEIVGCVINHPSIWAEQSQGIAKGGRVTDSLPPITYNWILANPIKFDNPIPAKGKLSFWEFVDEQLPEIK